VISGNWLDVSVWTRNLVGMLLGLIVEQILPRQADFMKMAPGQALNLDRALKGLKNSSREALSAINVYKKTLSRERQRQGGDRRSALSYSADQESLENLRYKASDKVDDLLGASERFLHFIAS
jgi:hypothetical protein